MDKNKKKLEYNNTHIEYYRNKTIHHNNYKLNIQHNKKSVRRWNMEEKKKDKKIGTKSERIS